MSNIYSSPLVFVAGPKNCKLVKVTRETLTTDLTLKRPTTNKITAQIQHMPWGLDKYHGKNTNITGGTVPLSSENVT